MAAPLVSLELLRDGRTALAAAEAAIRAATRSVRLESYIYGNDAVGKRFLRVLVEAAQRGVRVQVLVDAWGSLELDDKFFAPLVAVGGEARRFNPLSLRRFAFRNHRKLLICDDHVAVLGGFNFSSDYDGDGRTSGWCDLGVRVEGRPAVELARSFDELFALASFRHPRLTRFRKSPIARDEREPGCQLLFSAPGRGGNPLRAWLQRDAERAGEILIVAAYFLPPLRLRRALLRAARSGRRVRLLFGGKSDVPLSREATRSLYGRFLRAGIEIWEYEPQILHAKMLVADDVVYVGSSNLDPRSLEFNYELTLRVRQRPFANAAREHFERLLADSVRIAPENWRGPRTWWGRFRSRVAYWIVTKLDRFISHRQLRRLS
jgi:cardiolipin synthase